MSSKEGQGREKRIAPGVKGYYLPTMSLILMDLEASPREDWEQTLLLAREMARTPELLDGAGLVLVCQRDSGLAQAAEEENASEEGFLVEALPEKASTLGSLIALRRLFKREAPSLVHVFDLRSLNLALILRRFFSFRLLYTMRSLPVEHLRAFTRKLRKVDGIVFPGNDLLADSAKISVPSEKTRMILPAFSGCCTPELSTATPSQPVPSRFIFVAACALTEEKDVASLIQAMAYLQGMAIDLPPWEVRIIGEGPLFDPLLESAEKMGVAARLGLFGAQERGLFLDGANAVVSSTLSGLGDIPLIFDAWARKLPVACTSISAHAMLGTDREQFFLTEPGKPIPLAGSMLRLMTEHALREKIGQGGYDALPAFTAARMAQEYAECYRELTAPAAPAIAAENTDEDSAPPQ